jgi:hypothetical protein
MVIIIMILASSLIPSCNLPIEWGDLALPGERLYFNSFESLADTVGWSGYGVRTFSSEAPPGGGNQSLNVSGGCIWPHAFFTLGPSPEDHNVTLRCWGKKLLGGGTVSLRVVGSQTKEIRIPVIDSVWTQYHASQSLFCPADQQLEISMGAGGIVAGAMLVDMVEIVEMN